jgi:hypothetical protein
LVGEAECLALNCWCLKIYQDRNLEKVPQAKITCYQQLDLRLAHIVEANLENKRNNNLTDTLLKQHISRI